MTHRRETVQRDPRERQGLGQAMETMDFMKRAWAHFKVPTTFTPTMDVDELDKRIADLRTVEQWLTMNLGLLRNTIQAMELQRATLAALQNMASNFEEATRTRATDDETSTTSWPSMARSRADEADATDAGGVESGNAGSADVDADGADSSQATSMPAFPTSPFSLMSAFPFLMPAGTGATPAAGDDVGNSDEGHEGDHARSGEGPGAEAAATEPGFVAGDTDENGVKASASRSDEGRAGQGSEAKAASPGSGATAAGPGATAGGPDPLAWWRLLQSSFEQIAAAATANPTSPFATTTGQGAPAGQAPVTETKGRARSKRGAAASPGAKRSAPTRGAAAKGAAAKGAVARGAPVKGKTPAGEGASGKAVKGGSTGTASRAGKPTGATRSSASDATSTRGTGRRGSR